MNYYMGIPMFSYWGGYGRYNPNSVAGSNFAYQTANARAISSTAGSWPYGWVGYYGGQTSCNFIDSEQFSYQQAAEINKMIHNPNYIPYIDLSAAGGGTNLDINQAKANGKLAAMKDILKAKFDSLGTDLNNIISQAQNALSTQNLTSDQKTKIQEFINRAQEILKKREDFAKKSSSMELNTALREVSDLQQEYYQLFNDIKSFSSTVNGTNGNNGNNGVVDNNNNNNDDDYTPTEIPEPIGDDENITPEELQTRYEEQMKPAIEELLKSNELSRADKKAIQDKQKELEKAIEEGKSIEELKKLYNELSELANGKQSDIVTDKFKEKAEDLKADIDEIKDNENLTDEEKKALTDKLAELDKAIADGKSPEEIQDIIDDLTELKDRANSKIYYYENVKPQIEAILNDNKISDADKKAIQDKQKELEKAINRNKPLSEINKLKSELLELIENVGKIQEQNQQEEEISNLQNEINLATKNMEDINNWLTEKGKYLSSYQKKDSEFAYYVEELKKYMVENKDNLSYEQLHKLRVGMMEKFNELKRYTETLLNYSTEICGQIYESALRDNNRLIFGDSEYTTDEKNIIKNIKKLNKFNIFVFLKKWEDSYRQSSGQTCIIETIRHEFEEYKGCKTEKALTNYILNLIENWAKENNLEEKVKDKIKVIKAKMEEHSGNWASRMYDWSEVYNEFNRLLVDIGVRPQDGTVH